MRLDGKIVLLTGASGGMGRDMALLFAKEGAKVVAVTRRMEKLEEISKEAQDLKGGIIVDFKIYYDTTFFWNNFLKIIIFFLN